MLLPLTYPHNFTYRAALTYIPKMTGGSSLGIKWLGVYYLCEKLLIMLFTTGGISSADNDRGATYSFDTIFSWGKYKGRKVLDICVNDIEYLRWMLENGYIFALNVEKCIRGTKKKPIDFRKYRRKKKNED